MRQNKQSSIGLSLAPILQRLNIPSQNWLTIAIEFQKHTYAEVGTELILSNYSQNAGYKCRPKIGKTKQLLA